MIIQIIQINELTVPDSHNEQQSLIDLQTKYYDQCASNPDKVTKEIKIIHSEHK